MKKYYDVDRLQNKQQAISLIDRWERITGTYNTDNEIASRQVEKIELQVDALKKKWRID